MRILHCIPSMEGGGAERQLTYLAGALAAQGCDVHVALTRGGQNLARLEASGATIHVLGTAINHDPRLLTRMRRLIQTVAPDVVQCWLRQMQLAGGVAAVMTGTPWIVSERSAAHNYPPTLKHRLRARLAAKAAAIVSNSPAGDEYWRTRVPKVPRYIIGNAVPFDEIDATAAATAEEAGVEPGESLVLYAGRLDPVKNAMVVPRAVQRLPPSMPVRVLLCGDGPLRRDLERLIQEGGDANRLRLSAYTGNLWNLMKRAAMFVSPSRAEGSPNVVLEAIACGCPLVVSDIAAHREILDDDTAIFVAADDAGAIAAAIAAVMADPAAARGRAARAQQQLRRQAPTLVAERYLGVYRDVLSSRAAGAR
jgi:glycosyltransferase involved in cell wall biosynthesis